MQSQVQVRCEPHLLEVGVEVEKVEGVKDGPLTPHTQIVYHNKLLGMWIMTRRGGRGHRGGRRCNGGGGWGMSARGYTILPRFTPTLSRTRSLSCHK